jgi:hypothetical protein
MMMMMIMNIIMMIMMIIMRGWWQLYLLCEHLLDGFRIGEKRAHKNTRFVQGEKIVPVSRQYLV